MNLKIYFIFLLIKQICGPTWASDETSLTDEQFTMLQYKIWLNVSENLQKVLKKLNNIENNVTDLKQKTLEIESEQAEQYATIAELLKQNKANGCNETKTNFTSIKYPRDCSEVDINNCILDKCLIYTDAFQAQSFAVSCDQRTDKGGWTVIQRRTNGAMDFYRNWQDYKYGFGDVNGEFWLGLDKISALTSGKQMELRIILKDFNDNEKYANFNSFKIANETEKYLLKDVGLYSGNAGDSFSMHKGYKFSTVDSDNDEDAKSNCAISKTGAWWYEQCSWCNLNGKYYADGKVTKGKRGIYYESFNGYHYSMKFVQMMIRPYKNQ